MSKLVLATSLAATLALALGCGRPPAKDAGRVIANAGGEKITETDFQSLVRTLSPSQAQAETFLKDPAAREERARLADQLAFQKALMIYAKQQGLDKDPAVLRRIEQQQAQVYFQSLVQKRLAGSDPTDAQLQAFYKERVAQLQATGQAQAIPPYEQVKAQLPEMWRQQRGRQVSQDVQNDIRQKVPVTLADDYRPASQ
jgi:hypothetical protein